MTCPACGAENLPEARFCGRCGAQLVEGAPPPQSASNITSQADERRKSGGPWIGISLVVVLALILLIGFPYLLGQYWSGGGFIALLALVVLSGACIWVGVRGKWPGTLRRVHPIIRVLVSLIPIGLNGFLAFGVGYFVAADCEWCGNQGPTRAAGIALGVFLAAMAVEAIIFGVLLGVINGSLWVWRQASHAYASSTR